MFQAHLGYIRACLTKQKQHSGETLSEGQSRERLTFQREQTSGLCPPRMLAFGSLFSVLSDWDLSLLLILPVFMHSESRPFLEQLALNSKGYFSYAVVMATFTL